MLYYNSWGTAHGGSSTSLIDIVSRLDRSRFEPLVLCPEEGELTERLTEINVPFVARPISRLTREEALRFLREVPSYLVFLRRQRVDLVHANTYASRRSLVVAARILRVPLVQHVRNPVKRARDGFAYRFAARIVANSDATAAVLRTDPLFASKTVTIHNAVDLTRFREDDTCRNELGVGEGPVIGFVGHIVRNKGTHTLIQALPRVLSRYPHAKLVIVGCAPPGEPDYERECRGLVERLGLSSSVVFTGYRRDVPSWMRTFDVFALPTRVETFGKVVIEAMAASRPVVVPAVGGIPEIVNSHEVGHLVSTPDDAGAFADGILAYLDEPERAARVGAAARRRVDEHFDLEHMVKKLESLYDSLVQSVARQ